jgi:hypothetical protein
MKQNVLMKKRGIESWTEFKDRGFIGWRRPRQQKPGDSRRAILKKTRQLRPYVGVLETSKKCQKEAEYVNNA